MTETELPEDVLRRATAHMLAYPDTLPPGLAGVLARWLKACANELGLADGHVSWCDEPGSISQASDVARAYLEAVEGPHAPHR